MLQSPQIDPQAVLNRLTQKLAEAQSELAIVEETNIAYQTALGQAYGRIEELERQLQEAQPTEAESHTEEEQANG